MELNAELAEQLAEARSRTLAIVAPYDDAVLRRQHDPLMSPMVWDLAHIANYEDLWLVRALGGAPTRAGLDDLYDAFKQPRSVRETLPLLTPADAWAYGDAVRDRALDLLAAADLSPDAGNPLLRHGFVHNMVVQHEHQHDETLLAAVQLLPLDDAQVVHAPPPRPPGALPVEEILVPPGVATIGTDHPWAYDNERPPHAVDLDAYWIDAAPVTNAQYRAFVDSGGYGDPRWWGALGWEWCQQAGAVAPQFWRRDGSDWLRSRFGTIEVVPDDEPVQHVCWHEADAYARWAGKRLPTEAEWECAALGALADPALANLGQRHLQPAPVGAYPEGVSDVGCHQMLGDVWEWTSTDFGPHPGFVAFPYDEYSAVFHGDRYKVLRGGSWATHPRAVRTSFRNWDLPIRRQIFAGFRCARDAA
ncbi:MAG: ergothioneine biosynthesis protein EgtB [Microthrixaceae bacterium]